MLDPTLLLDLVKMQMPYGKYKGYLICNIPESYLLWYKDKGFPKGKLGDLMATMFEIRVNGLEYLLTPLKNQR
ncbi:hypothetical protein D3C87_544930 [compost metagenome]|jgi:uncharacterized protein (DUF3820 family)|uniref:DUF3820 family protein n=3 Tax=Pedobacter TaxID=84567 RepID=A0A497XVF6_9SPHI|nr:MULTISPECIES: DUF3820 family protein [Pedobacter]MBO9673389.1 DUF3820 family protein [Sphingobacteriaceae bacterium]MBE5317838.1 DUF3820 family protein [Pedobacter sp. MR2016-19]MDQ0636764.1 uncharacterized protein (DUF3820 family) [Pedobacter sp. W3I1]RLJ73556.1 hypothetical protein BCL90_3713 [Pedobacter alluvionis]TFB32813.1 hypothetical protein E3V97_01885 [Pedobacter alluvionis]